MKPKLYVIKGGFAKRANIPAVFVGIPLRETERAVYLYGHGTLESKKIGACCVCGRGLTHPVSIKLGIGPICGGHDHDWDTVGGYSLENIERLIKEMTIKIKDRKVDQWFPKSVIKDATDSETTIEMPKEHKMIEAINPTPTETKTIGSPKPVERKAILVKFQSTGAISLRITFPYNPIDVTNVKTLEGRKFNSEHKYWTCYLTAENVQQLRTWEFEVDSRADEYINKDKIDIKDLKEIKIPGLKMDLFPFQSKGVSFIETKNGRALVADEMGLGKTAQALAWLQLHKKDIHRTLAVVPASLKLNWKKEIRMWMEEQPVQIS